MKIVIGLIAAIVILGGLYVVTKDDVPADTSEEQMMENDSEMTSGEQFSGSFKELVMRAGDHQCSFSHVEESGSAEGIIYTSGDDFRIDSTAVVAGLSIESSVLKKDDMLYLWIDGFDNTKGVQSRWVDDLADVGDGVNVVSLSQEQKLDENEMIACTSYSADRQLFEVPSHISFEAVSDQVIRW